MHAARPSPRHDAPRIHIDPLSGRGVFVAPQRAERPDDAALAAGLTAERPRPESWCPFCAGNEFRTPPASVRTPDDEALPWRSRIVPNRYPIAVDESATAGDGRAAVGVHDVVIEAAAHERSILAVEPAAWREVWDLVRRRLAMLAERDDIAWATVFKNSGTSAGASLEHVHSQIVGLDLVPPAIEAELATLARHADPFGDLLLAARAEDRVIAESSGVVALVPPAPRQPFETWILPTAPESHFHEATPDRVAAVADLTRDLVARLDAVASGADYNWWLHQAPFARAPSAGKPMGRWHWHVEILPRVTQLAGFELGTGCHITTVPAFEAARRLRAAAE